MIFSIFSPLLLFPFVSAAGVHRLKLQKIQLQNHNPLLETAYLAEKYGGQQQTPLMGAGGAGRQLRASRPSKNEDGDDLLWTQEMIFGGGHNVPLSSKCWSSNLLPSIGQRLFVRFHERPVLHDNYSRYSTSGGVL